MEAEAFSEKQILFEVEDADSAQYVNPAPSQLSPPHFVHSRNVILSHSWFIHR